MMTAREKVDRLAELNRAKRIRTACRIIARHDLACGCSGHDATRAQFDIYPAEIAPYIDRLAGSVSAPMLARAAAKAYIADCES